MIKCRVSVSAWECMVHDSTHGLLEHLKSESRTLYMGTDITAKSLHAGHLVLLLMLKRLQEDGHRIIILLGGATSLIGDPTGRNTQRPMLSLEQIAGNIAGIKRSVSAVLGEDVMFVNNADWLLELRWIDVLRELGTKVSVNKLVKTDTFAQRLNNNQNLSFLELCYPLCQAFDFVHLDREYDCTVQCGGSDQWANILAGARLQEGLHGMTCPLLTDAKGQKISKSTAQEAWIDPEISTAFELWQFFRNLPDDVILNMHYVPVDSTGDINARKAQVASYMTALVYGEGAAREAEVQSSKIYAEGIVSAMPERAVDAGVLHKVLCVLGLAGSSSAARTLVRQGAVKIDGVVAQDECAPIDKPCAIVVGNKGYRAVVHSNA